METGHPIQVVAQRTGLSTDVIRMWERRYQAVTPMRVESARRIYSDADIDRLRLLRKAVASGFRISDVARLADKEIAEVLKSSATAPESSSPAGVYLEACLLAISQLDQTALRQRLLEAEAALSLPQLLENLITGLLDRIGTLWEQGKLRVAHEHMASTVIHSFLNSILATSNMTGNGPGIVVATPAGQNHGLGVLMAAIMAASDGWKPLLLGANIPAVEIAAAARQTQSPAIALGLTFPGDDQRIRGELRKLRDLLPAATVIFAGGNAAPAYGEALTEINACLPASLGDFRIELRKLRQSVR
jgi:MerR family transcriptional regulator, light-induced transcriptional regulator